jgi:hypothetical protein
VFVQTIPDAPASRAAVAIDTALAASSADGGGILTKSGVEVRARTARTNAPVCELACSHPAFGLLALSSMPSTNGSRSSAVATVSATGSSAIETNRGAVRGVRARFRATASAPGFGIPIAFTIARRAGSRAILGCGFPRRGARVTVPPTTYPNPREPKASRRAQLLSNPAARPTGFRSGTPASVVVRAGSSTAPPILAHGSGSPSRRSARRWDRSGSIEKNTRRPTAWYQPIGRPY